MGLLTVSSGVLQPYMGHRRKAAILPLCKTLLVPRLFVISLHRREACRPAGFLVQAHWAVSGSLLLFGGDARQTDTLPSSARCASSDCSSSGNRLGVRTLTVADYAREVAR